MNTHALFDLIKLYLKFSDFMFRLETDVPFRFIALGGGENASASFEAKRH